MEGEKTLKTNKIRYLPFVSIFAYPNQKEQWLIVSFGIQKKGRLGKAKEISSWSSHYSEVSRESGWSRQHTVWLRPLRPGCGVGEFSQYGFQARAEIRDLKQWQFIYTLGINICYGYVKASFSYLWEMRINMGYIFHRHLKKKEVKRLARYHT